MKGGPEKESWGRAENEEETGPSIHTLGFWGNLASLWPFGPFQRPFLAPRNERKASPDLEKDLECLSPKGPGESVDGDGQRLGVV